MVCYGVNSVSISNRLQFEDPRPGAQKGVKGVYGVPRAYERSFRWKLSQFRYLCQSNALPSHIKITVTRQTLFEDSYHQIMRLPAYELRRRLYIIFVSFALFFSCFFSSQLVVYKQFNYTYSNIYHFYLLLLFQIHPNNIAW